MVTLLVSHERSGSHLVGEYLQSLSAVSMFDEVCNSQASIDYAYSFHKFQLDYASKDERAFLMRTVPQHLQFLTEYFNLITSASQGAPVIDVKYGHLHNFEWYWSPHFRIPQIFNWLKENGGRVVHLYRNNPIEAVVSAFVAQKRGIWHSWQKGAIESTKTRHTLNVAQIVNDAKLLQRQTKFLRDECLVNVESFNLTYENFVFSLSGDKHTLSELANFVGGYCDGQWQPKLKKLGRPLKETVENYAELESACIEAQLGEFIEN